MAVECEEGSVPHREMVCRIEQCQDDAADCRVCHECLSHVYVDLSYLGLRWLITVSTSCLISSSVSFSSLKSAETDAFIDDPK